MKYFTPLELTDIQTGVPLEGILKLRSIKIMSFPSCYKFSLLNPQLLFYHILIFILVIFIDKLLIQVG